MSDCPFILVHATGCQKPALRMTRRPQAWDPIRSSMFRHLDGSEVQSGSKMACDNCGGQLLRVGLSAVADFHTSNVREEAA